MAEGGLKYDLVENKKAKAGVQKGKSGGMEAFWFYKMFICKQNLKSQYYIDT